MNPRLRRLQADYEAILGAFGGHPYVFVTPVGPAPPERYEVVFNVPGLVLDGQNQLQVVAQHAVSLQLPASYPREKPYCTASPQIFHPNFGAYVCIADFWNPSQSIVDIIVQIGEMLQYKLYNTRSPLNAVAARWALENLERLPLANLDLYPREPEVRLGRTLTTEVDETCPTPPSKTQTPTRRAVSSTP